MLIIAKGSPRQKTMLEISWNSMSHRDHYVIYIHLNLSDIDNRTIKDILPDYIPNIWSLEYTEFHESGGKGDSKLRDKYDCVLYLPLIPQLKETYLQKNNMMRKKIAGLITDNIDYILRNPKNNIMDQSDKEIATMIGNEILNNIKSINPNNKANHLQKNKWTRSSHNYTSIIVLLIFVIVFILIAIKL